MSPDKPRVVIDTGVLISRFLSPRSVPAQAVDRSLDCSTILFSADTAIELYQCVQKPKFAGVIDIGDAERAIGVILSLAEHVEVVMAVAACRDPDDDKFLSLAVSGDADVIITGDADLLTLHPFDGVDILTQRQFLEAFSIERASPADAL